jgi:geranylgeranyl pyrophosphate synthase
LIHDDLPAMDNADERRGQPSCHRRFGEANAMLAGDALLTLAFQLLSRNGTHKALAILQVVGQASGTEGLIGGQVLDLLALRQVKGPSSRALRAIAQRKTAALIRASVVSGAIAGQATAGQLNRLSRFGGDVGLAFQLIDDIHDQEGLCLAMGREAARREAHQLIDRAINTLNPFGGRAQVLWHLATRLVET